MMSSSAPDDVSADGGSHPWSEWKLLLAIGAFFLLCRTPVMYRQPGGQDEDCYAVPGLTILECGVPRLPHVPARNPESVYYRADEALFCEPPLYFYWQALFFAVLPDVYGTARLASMAAGVIGLLLIYRLAVLATGSKPVGVWAAALFSLSRWFFFPAICARPDMLAGVWGFAAVWSTFHWECHRRLSGLIRTGVLIGLGGLTHPFALVYAVEIAVWIALVSRGWRRLTLPAVVATAALLATTLWLPLILRFPEAFEVQFRNQFVHDDGGSLWWRLLWPWESLRYHFAFSVGYAGIWQLVLTFGGLAIGTGLAVMRGDRLLQRVCGLSWGGIYLTCTFVGPHHPALNYFVYPIGLAFIAVAGLVQAAIAAWTLDGGWRRLAARFLATALVCSFAIGGGYRTLWVHLTHWNDINYDSPRFARRLMEQVPADAVCAVDTQFVLDFVAAGRPTLLCQTIPKYFRVDQFRSDYLFISRYGLAMNIVQDLPSSPHSAAGVRDDPFACYCEIRVPDRGRSDSNH